MSKPLLFLSFSIFLSVGATDVIGHLMHMQVEDGPTCLAEHAKLIECVEPHASLINHAIDTFQPNIFYNIGFMRKGLQISKNVSECLGKDLKCNKSRFVVFTLDTVGYVGEKVYGDAFHCFINANAIETLKDAKIIDMLSKEEWLSLNTDPSIFRKLKDSIFEHVARELYPTPSCTIRRIVDLYKAGNAGMDWYPVALKMKSGEDVDLDFDAGKYCEN